MFSGFTTKKLRANIWRQYNALKPPSPVALAVVHCKAVIPLLLFSCLFLIDSLSLVCYAVLGVLYSFVFI